MSPTKKKPAVFTMGTGHKYRLAGTLEFSALRTDWDGHISLLVRHFDPGPKGYHGMAIATELTFERVDPEPGVEYPTDPTLKLKFHEAQQLMDELWAAGCRPAEAVGTDSERAATRQHLDDMRQLVSHYAKVNLPTKTGR